MSDFSNISSSSMARMGMSVAVSGDGQEESAAKSHAGETPAKAKNTVGGRIVAWLGSSHPSKAASEIKQKLFAAIGHLLGKGTLANLLTRAAEHLRGAKQLLARAVSTTPPPGIEKWLELDSMQSSLATLKLERDMLHEQTRNYYHSASQDLKDDKSLHAARKGYAMEAEVKAKVETLEKDVAELATALRPHKRPAAGRMPAAHAAQKPAPQEEIQQPADNQPRYALPAQSHPHAGLQARLRRYQQHAQNPTPAAPVSARSGPGAPAYFVPASMARAPASATAGVKTGAPAPEPTSIANDLARVLAEGKASTGTR